MPRMTLGSQVKVPMRIEMQQIFGGRSCGKHRLVARCEIALQAALLR
jgi:hypothetical protein